MSQPYNPNQNQQRPGQNDPLNKNKGQQQQRPGQGNPLDNRNKGQQRPGGQNQDPRIGGDKGNQGGQKGGF